MRNTKLLILVICFYFVTPTVLAVKLSSNQKIMREFREQNLDLLQNIAENTKHQLADKTFIKKQLLTMAKIDQAVRDVYLIVEKNCTVVNDSCTRDFKDYYALMNEIDSANLAILKTMLQRYPWFKKSEFGKDGAQAAWLIVQHASDVDNPENLDLQIRILFLMQHLLKINEADPQNFALLYDRISLSYQDFGLKQHYGSQFRLSDDRKSLILAPCDANIAEIDARRKEIGLEPVLQNMQRLIKEYGIQTIVLD